MPICWKRLVQVRWKACFICASLIAIIQLFCFGVYNYEYSPQDVILSQLYRKTCPNLVNNSNTPCDYHEVLSRTTSAYGSFLYWDFNNFSPKGIIDGSYAPKHCNPSVSVAILVTYRNRQKQLDIFLPYMHNFLRRQNIHYKIFLIEQQDEKPWNKGKLYNIGARVAIAEKFPCLILHDVDLLPLDWGNLYACLGSPRHMSASVDKFRYVLPYPTLVGGVLAIRADQFVAVDGFSTRFEQWGGEDDDFSRRLRRAYIRVIRFPRELSRYTMLHHIPAERNLAVRRILAENAVTPGNGYKATTYTSMRTKNHRLFTLIEVVL